MVNCAVIFFVMGNFLFQLLQDMQKRQSSGMTGAEETQILAEHNRLRGQEGGANMAELVSTFSQR